MSFPKFCKREDFSRPRSLKYARARACRAAERVSVEPAKVSKSDNHQQEPREIATSAAHRQLYFEGFGKTTPDNVVSIEERCNSSNWMGRFSFSFSALQATAVRSTSRWLQQASPRFRVRKAQSQAD